MRIAFTSSFGSTTKFAHPSDRSPGRRVLLSQCKAIIIKTHSKIYRPASESARPLFARSHRTLRPGLESAARVVHSTMSGGSLPSQDEVAVVLVDHGSKRTEANEMLEEFAALYRCVVCVLPAILLGLYLNCHMVAVAQKSDVSAELHFGFFHSAGS